MKFVSELIEEIPNLYGLDFGDLNGDGKPDLVVGSTREPFLAWYAAPHWERIVVSRDHTGNIGIGIHDIDRDGRADLAVASGFNPGIQAQEAYLHWFRQPESADHEWEEYLIDRVPFIHRIAWEDVDGDGRRELVVATIRGSEGGHLDWSDPGWLGFYRVPEDPTTDEWSRVIIDGHLCLNHGLAFARLTDEARDGGPVNLLVGARDGLFWYEHLGGTAWQRHRISDRETSEVCALQTPDGRTLGVVAVEPWHGSTLCWYRAPEDLRVPDWERVELDDTLGGGHSLACADLDGDGLVEIVTGSFQSKHDLRVYHTEDGDYSAWKCRVIDRQMGPGQAYVTDLNGDGRPEIIVSGIPTGNLKIYSAGE